MNNVFVYTYRNDDSPNLTLAVYGTRADANARLREDVEKFFEEPWDELKEIPYNGGVNREERYISADHVEYSTWNGNYYWDVDEREVI